MKASDYHLHTLFGIREANKKIMEKEYVNAVERLKEAEAQLLRLHNELDGSIECRRQRQREIFFHSEPESAKILHVKNSYLEILHLREKVLIENIEKQTLAVDKLNELKEIAFSHYVVANKNFKIIEKHKEQWMTGQKNSKQKKAEDIADEISQAQFFRAKIDRNKNVSHS